MSRHYVLLASLSLAFAPFAAAEEATPAPQDKPQWQRMLQGDDAKQAAELLQRSVEAERADRFQEAIEHAEALVALRARAQGDDHWETTGAKRLVVYTRKLAGLSADERADWRRALKQAQEADQLQTQRQYARSHALGEAFLSCCLRLLGKEFDYTASAYNGLAAGLQAQAKYADALPLNRQVLALRRESLGDKHPFTARAYNDLARNLNALGKYAEAQPLFQRALDLRREILGERHVDTAASYNNLATNLNALGQYAEAQPFYQRALELLLALYGEKTPGAAKCYDNLAVNLAYQAKYAEAQPLLEKALDLRRELFGEKHPDTAKSYHSLAFNLYGQGKYAEAEPHDRKALELKQELLGERHPDTAASYNNLGEVLKAQAKYAEAEALHRKALDLRRALLGEKHPDTATSYHNLAHVLDAQGKRAAAEPLFERSLALSLEALGEKHPLTATLFTSLASNLNAQGNFAAAQPLFEKALALHRELLGERHPHTAASYRNLATNLNDRGQHAEALLLMQKALELRLLIFGERHPEIAAACASMAHILRGQRSFDSAETYCRKALELRLELFGEKHADTAASYFDLAHTLYLEEKYAEAESLFQKALELDRELFGERHPRVVECFNALACNLTAQGKYSEGLPLAEKVVELRRELFGASHLESPKTYANLGCVLYHLGKYAEARPWLSEAAACFEAARLRAAGRGLERATFESDQQSPYRLLAEIEAREGHPRAAWAAAEADLARCFNDEAALHRTAAFDADEANRHAALSARLDQIAPRQLDLVTKPSLTKEETTELAALEAERGKLENELVELAVAGSQHEVATLADVQAALPADAALLLWIDISDLHGGIQRHWGCVVRSTGDPHWERLPGSNADGEWTAADAKLTDKLRDDLAGTADATDLSSMAARLCSQRLAPVEKHLDGVRRLLVVPVQDMLGVPVEVLSDKYVVSYIPSGTFLARLGDFPPANDDGLLALGDPVVPPPDERVEPPLPPGGILVRHVAATGGAAQANMLPGDVVLKYAGTEVTSLDQFRQLAQEHQLDESVALTVWRGGQRFESRVPSGKLGVIFDPEPAATAATAKTEADQLLLALRRGGAWRELPGTLFELAALQRLFGDERSLLLTRSAASENELDRLCTSGKLAGFRYLHFATHGEPNLARAFESALILSQDHLAHDLPAGGGKYYDGRLTANEVLENWKLNADLVTLSACESALGRPGGGDGLLGFAQAFLLAGARSVCLSLWKVDDSATALLMDRFYQNLLGKREGLSQPMPKAEALAEAKRWLRELHRDDAQRLTAALTTGLVRGKGEKPVKLVVPGGEAHADSKADDHPFSHPRYWAAFILIGDPN
jgi:tetratricopeptide (TPR) repeat protein